MKSLHRQTRIVRCIRNAGYAFSLKRGKTYVALPDKIAHKHDMIRVIDESGEDYLFSASCIAPLDIETVGRKLGIRTRKSPLQPRVRRG